MVSLWPGNRYALATAVAAAIAGAHLFAQSPPRTAGATVSGRVIDADTGQPIRNATVFLTPASRMSAAALAKSEATSESTPRMRSLADGTFVFRDVRAGGYYLNTNADGYLRGQYGQIRPDTAIALLEVINGRDESALTIKMWKPAIVRGRVTDSDGKPVPSRWIVALRRQMGGGPREFAEEDAVYSDKNGEYALTRLLPGDYIILAPSTTRTAPASYRERAARGVDQPMAQFMASEQVRSELGGAVNPNPPTESLLATTHPAGGETGNFITINAGDVIERADIAMRRVRTYRVSGVVRGPDGPVADAVLRLVGADWAAWGVAPGTFGDVARAATDEAGRFSLAGVPPGSYVLSFARFPLAAHQSQDRVRVANTSYGAIAMRLPFELPPEISVPAQTTLWGRLTVGVSDDDVNVDVVASEAAVVSGQVEFAGQAPRPAAELIERLLVGVRSASEIRHCTGPAPFALVRSDGTFSTAGIPPGRYAICVPDIGGPWHLRSIQVGGREVVDSMFDLDRGDVSGVRIVFSDRETTIEGRVQADAIGSQIILVPANTGRWIENGMPPRTFRTVAAGRDGSFRMTNLLPGDYLIGAADGATKVELADPVFLAALAASGKRITLREGDARTESLTVFSLRR